MNLLKRARQVLSSEQNILVIDAPATIIGDIHGQYFDLRQIMRIVGKPRREQNKVSPLCQYFVCNEKLQCYVIVHKRTSIHLF